jgi:hypothetical protein
MDSNSSSKSSSGPPEPFRWPLVSDLVAVAALESLEWQFFCLHR